MRLGGPPGQEVPSELGYPALEGSLQPPSGNRATAPGRLGGLLSWMPLVGHPGASAVAPPTETRRAVTLTFCGDVLGGGPPESWFLWDVQFGGN